MRNSSSPFQALITIPVAAIIVGSFALSAAAMVENLRFINATNQILDLVGMVRSAIVVEKSFAQNPGEDIWADLAAVGRVTPGSNHPNPWGGGLRSQTIPIVNNTAMRIETDLPAHDCRRMAVYFLEHQPAEMGLLAVEGHSADKAVWEMIYPLSAGYSYVNAAGSACGNAEFAHLALIFKTR